MVFPPREFCKECYGNSQGMYHSDQTYLDRVPCACNQIFFSSYEQLCPFLSLSPNNPIEGLNLWDEFDRARVLDFLRQLYSQNRLLQQVSHLSLVAANMCKILKFDSKYLLKCIPQGLSGSNTGLGHALVPLAREDEKLDTGNFRFWSSFSSTGFSVYTIVCIFSWLSTVSEGIKNSRSW